MLGAVDLGILPGSGKPYRDRNGSLAIVHGEITNLSAGVTPAAALLDAYRRDPASLTRLRGSYVAAIWDSAQGRLLLTNDRFGTRNLYYTIIDDVICFAPLVSALLAVPEVDRSIDLAAVTDFLTFYRILGDRTLLRAVRMLPPATIATFDAEGLRLERYWVPLYQDGHAKSVDECVEELARRLAAAVERMTSGPVRPGLPLSGGLDSRAILSVLGSGQPEVPCFTYGVPGCADLLAATQLACAVRAPHYTFELTPGFIAERAEKLACATDGMHLALNVHALVLRQCAQWCNLVLLGNGGDSLLDLTWQAREEPPHSGAYAQRMFQYLNEAMSPAVGARLLDRALRSEFETGPPARLRERLALFPGRNAKDAADAYNVGENDWRYTLQGVPAQSTHVEFRQPFYDHDVVDLALTVPARWRTHRRLHVELIRRYAPALALVPRQGTGRPLTAEPVDPRLARLLELCSRLAGRAKQTLRGPRVSSGQHLGGFADYGYELRNGSRTLLEDVVLSERTFARGWYRPDRLRELVTEHLSCRHNHAGALGAIVTLEFWLRAFIDHAHDRA